MSFKYEYRIIKDTSIEFLGYSHDDPLLVTIYNILKKINVPMISLENVWKLDELSLEETSDYGEIRIVKNEWGDIFIFTKKNKLLEIIDNLLDKDKNFKKV